MEENVIKIEEEPEVEPAKEGEEPKILDLKVEVEAEFSYIDFHADGLWRAGKNTENTPFSFLKSIEIINTTGETIPGLAITFSFDNEAFSIDDVILPPCPSPAGRIRLPWLKVKKPLIDNLTEKIPCELSANLISIDDERIIASSKHVFHVLPISQPTLKVYEDRRLLAKYVTPLAPSVKQITNKAVLHNNGNPIVAYQNHSANEMLEELHYDKLKVLCEDFELAAETGNCDAVQLYPLSSCFSDVFSHLPENTVVVFDEDRAVFDTAALYEQEFTGRFESLYRAGAALSIAKSNCANVDALKEKLKK